MNERDLKIRLLAEDDIASITKAFEEFGWNKPASQYQRYFMEQKYEVRDVYVALVEGQFAGYLTICWKSTYRPFREKNIPEIVDLNVLPKFRRMGIGTQLMDTAERAIAKVSPVAGIGTAQRLCILRGYIPDGLGLHWRDHHTQYGEQVKVDDDLALYLTKEVK